MSVYDLSKDFFYGHIGLLIYSTIEAQLNCFRGEVARSDIRLHHRGGLLNTSNQPDMGSKNQTDVASKRTRITGAPTTVAV
jgi:hypothetical protein